MVLSNNPVRNVLTLSLSLHPVSPDDYGGVIGQIIQFNTGDTNQTHTIIIRQDDICEDNPNEFFLSNIVLDSGAPPIEVIHPQARVIIDETFEPECSKTFTHTCIQTLFLNAASPLT